MATKWSYKKVLAVAKSCKSKTEFRTKHEYVYKLAGRLGYRRRLYAELSKAWHTSEHDRQVYVLSAPCAGTGKLLVYVGISVSATRRAMCHRCAGKDTVRRLFSMPGFSLVIKHSGKALAEHKAVLLEKRLIERYSRDKNTTVLNDTREAGQLGRVGAVRWTPSAIAEAAAGYHTLRDFRKALPGAYVAAKKQGLDKTLLGGLRRGTRPYEAWTIKALTEEALRFKTRSEFAKMACGAYEVALEKGVLDRVCRHMKLGCRPVGYWTEATILSKAKQFSSLKEFTKAFGGAYNAARRLGVTDKLKSSFS